MKKLLLIIVVSLFAISLTNAQDSQYQKAIKKEIAKVIETDSLPLLQESANTFARIAAMNPKEWQPLYYGSLAYIFQGLNKTSELNVKDEALAKAEELIKKADAISPDNAEIVTLQGFILMAKVNADPSNRGQNLSGQVMATYGKALSIDNKNPRALALMAQMEYGMAQFFGSGSEKACKLAKQSQAIYAGQDEQALKAGILPTWGKSMVDNLLKKCRL
ncbi:hypothetical protein [Dyadobacter sp. NIV53]|uniref:hypothetical protein n=1 Tax=Dyadobacter sp. NIV53 TaxID=2861765 RepID=UPI001C879FE6|nr:hypothetical protein [Dyadobacter sp. NIV53]